MVYGFALQAGLGIGLWLLARLGRSVLACGFLVIVGAIFFNLGVAVGVAGILAGDSTGFELFDMPGYAALLILVGYVLISVSGVLTFHYRSYRPLFASQWFLLAALLWFPWIYCTANLLLLSFPVRGVAQAVIAWWYSQNLLAVWLGLAGLASTFYLIPALTERPLHSRYLALFAFWVLILFGSWAGIPASAPVPAWMPVTSTIAKVMLLTLVLAVALNVYQTLGRFALIHRSKPTLSFVLFGVAAFIVASLMSIGAALWSANPLLSFSWFSSAQFQLQVYGFFVLVAFGAIYHVLPRVAGAELPWLKLVRGHFWLAASGIVLTALPLAAGGLLQATQMQKAEVGFVDVAKSTLPFLRVSTVGELLLLVGGGFLLVNILWLVARIARARFAHAYDVATEDLFQPAEVKA